MAVLEVKELTKKYGQGEAEVIALDHVSFSVERGEFVAIVGASGSGKSTLMNLIGGLDHPTGGSVIIEENDITSMSEDELAIFRRRNLGIIYQFYNLIPTLTAEENIALPWKLDGRRENKKRLAEILQLLGLEKRAKHLPGQMSGGQQQRVSIGRALINEPAFILADEPTGSVTLVQHYPKEIPVIFWSLSILISLITERHNVRFSSRVKVSYKLLKSVCSSCSTASKFGGGSCPASGIWFSAAV